MMIQYFSKYYEDVKNHYIAGTFFSPFLSDICWDGGMAKVFDRNSGKEIIIKIFKDRLSIEKYYNIIFLCEDKKYIQFDYNGKRIDNFSDAKQYAAYLIEMHLNGNMTIAFR